jgi:glyoxylase-like metal-dependent hydrolase (beta-lactamase superfamily II)
MKGLKIRMFYLGHIKTKKDLVVRTDNKEEVFYSPMLSVLFQHPTLGNILYDTGNNETGDANYGMHAKEVYPVGEVITIKERLGEIGLTVNDIDRIIISHLHMDHTGGLLYFANTKAAANGVIINEDDGKQAFYTVYTSEDPGAYVKQNICDIPGLTYAPMNEELKLADDLILFTQRCHTPGVIGILAKTKNNGNFIFTSDAIYTKESYENLTPPGGTINKTDDEFYNHLKVIKDMQKKYNAQVIFGHDPNQFKEWKDKIID